MAIQTNGGFSPANWIQWLLVVAVAGGLGITGSYIHRQIEPPRPDPFTGTMGRELEQRVNARIDLMDERGTRHVANVQARISDCERRTGSVETSLAKMIEQIGEVRIIVARMDARQSAVLREHKEAQP